MARFLDVEEAAGVINKQLLSVDKDLWFSLVNKKQTGLLWIRIGTTLLDLHVP
jgi:hypothetical protein